MFCSKCGKTIHAADVTCPNCQAPIGDNRFDGIPYTSAQFTIAPGQKTFGPLNNYTKTTYTSMDDAAQEGGEVGSRTTYRPVYEGASTPKSVRRDMRAAMSGADESAAPSDDAAKEAAPEAPLSQAAQETLEELDEELKPEEEIDRSQFQSRPIQSTGRAGISRDVSEYIRQLEDSQTRRAARRRGSQAPVYDDYAEPDAQGAPAPEYADENDLGEIDEADYEDARGGRFGGRQIIKVIIALVVVAAIVVGGIVWLRYVRGNSSSAPIEGVSETFYEEGIALIKTHVDSTYVNEMIAKYTSDTGGMIALSASLSESSAALDALMPAEPASNDQTFMEALQAIETNINNSIVMDALAVGGSDENAVENSEANWTLVNNSIAQLEAARSAAELTAIINGQTVTVQTQTPAPTEEPVVYTTLQKGDESQEVQQMQVRLYELGYLNDNRDGVFGSKTQTAVKAFQENAGLSATGIADNDTLTLLYSEDAPYAPGATTPTPEPTEAMIQPAEAGASDTSSDGTQAA